MMETIDVKALQVHESSLGEVELDLCRTGGPRNWPRTPYPIDEEINQRVILYNGDVELLSAEAIVNPTNENLTQLDYVSRMAGLELDGYIKRHIKSCATGDVRLTPGFKSHYKYIIHAVPPKYQAKYKTAAETALFHTYFRILELMIEKRIRTVVLPTLTTSKCNMPIEDNCNLQLRTIRRILEKKRHEFDKIVVHVGDVDIYKRPFYCYFPRTQLDEEIACYHFAHLLGGPNGEPVIPEREIRIKSKPAASTNLNDNSIDLTSGLDLSTCVGKTQFSKMQEDISSYRGSGICHTNTSNINSNNNNNNDNYLSPNRRTNLESNNRRAVVVARNNRRSVLTGCNLF